MCLGSGEEGRGRAGTVKTQTSKTSEITGWASSTTQIPPPDWPQAAQVEQNVSIVILESDLSVYPPSHIHVSGWAE